MFDEKKSKNSLNLPIERLDFGPAESILPKNSFLLRLKDGYWRNVRLLKET
jgi:hypothetical protein